MNNVRNIVDTIRAHKTLWWFLLPTIIISTIGIGMSLPIIFIMILLVPILMPAFALINIKKKKSLATNIIIKFFAAFYGTVLWWYSSQFIRNYFNIGGTETEGFEIFFIPILAIIVSAIVICFEIFWHKELYNQWIYVIIVTSLGFAIFDFFSETRVALIYNDLLSVFPEFIGIVLGILSFFIPIVLLLTKYHFYLKKNN